MVVSKRASSDFLVSTNVMSIVMIGVEVKRDDGSEVELNLGARSGLLYAVNMSAGSFWEFLTVLQPETLAVCLTNYRSFPLSAKQG